MKYDETYATDHPVDGYKNSVTTVLWILIITVVDNTPSVKFLAIA